MKLSKLLYVARVLGLVGKIPYRAGQLALALIPKAKAKAKRRRR